MALVTLDQIISGESSLDNIQDQIISYESLLDCSYDEINVHEFLLDCLYDEIDVHEFSGCAQYDDSISIDAIGYSQQDHNISFEILNLITLDEIILNEQNSNLIARSSLQNEIIFTFTSLDPSLVPAGVIAPSVSADGLYYLNTLGNVWSVVVPTHGYVEVTVGGFDLNLLHNRILLGDQTWPSFGNNTSFSPARYMNILAWFSGVPWGSPGVYGEKPHQSKYQITWDGFEYFRRAHGVSIIFVDSALEDSIPEMYNQLVISGKPGIYFLNLMNENGKNAGIWYSLAIQTKTI